MQRNQIGINIALTLLVGVFILGGALFNIATGDDDPNFEKTIYFDALGNEVEEEDSVASLYLKAAGFGGTTDDPIYTVDPVGKSASVYLSGERIVDGVSIGSVSISGGVYAYTDDTFCYYAGAYSSINGNNTARGNAWVMINDEHPDHSRGVKGDVHLGGYYPSYVSSWHLIEREHVGGNTVSAGAALGFDQVRVRVRFDASGV